MIPELLAAAHRDIKIPTFGETQRFQDALNYCVQNLPDDKFLNYRQAMILRDAKLRNVFTNVHKRVVLRHKFFGTDCNSELLEKLSTQIILFSSSILRKRFFFIWSTKQN